MLKDPDNGCFVEFSVTLMNLPSALLRLVSSAEQTCTEIGKNAKENNNHMVMGMITTTITTIMIKTTSMTIPKITKDSF